MNLAQLYAEAIRRAFGKRRSDPAVARFGCISCDEGAPDGECEASPRYCGHHCNHSWTHDDCCWCRAVSEVG